MNDQQKERGVYRKFRVERTDGKSAPGQKHFGCEYFVLDTIHDPHAKPALLAYAASCESKYPELAEDARRMASGERVLAQQETPSPERTPCACRKALEKCAEESFHVCGDGDYEMRCLGCLGHAVEAKDIKHRSDCTFAIARAALASPCSCDPLPVSEIKEAI